MVHASRTRQVTPVLIVVMANRADTVDVEAYCSDMAEAVANGEPERVPLCLDVLAICLQARVGRAARAERPRRDGGREVQRRVHRLAGANHNVALLRHKLKVARRVLRWAAANGELALVRCLCNLPPQYCVEPGVALTAAAEAGHLDMVHFLCSVPGVNPAANRSEALVSAARAGHLEVLQCLCNHVPRVINLVVLVAATRGHVDIVRFLCELPAERGVNPSVALLSAAQQGRLAVVRYLCELPLERGVEPGAALLGAAAQGHGAVVRYLCELPLERGVEPGAANNSALVTAAAQGHVAVVRYMCELPLERGVDPGAANNSALIAAAAQGHVAVVRYLCELPLERGVNPGASNNRALQKAILRGHEAVVRYLCELPTDYGVDPTAANVTVLGNFTPFNYAAMRMPTSFVRYLCGLLLARGVDLVAACNIAVRAAAGSGRLDTVRFLCEEALPAARGVVDPTSGNNAALAFAATATCSQPAARRSVVWYLLDRPGVVQKTPTYTLAKFVVNQRVTSDREHAVGMLKFVTQELPGGDQWLDRCDGEERVRYLDALAVDGSPECTEVCKKWEESRVWRRRFPILRLRTLCDQGRAVVLSHAMRSGTKAVRTPPHHAKQHRM